MVKALIEDAADTIGTFEIQNSGLWTISNKFGVHPGASTA